MATSRRFVQITDKEINKIKQLFASGSVIIGEYSPRLRLGEYSPIIPRLRRIIVNDSVLRVQYFVSTLFAFENSHKHKSQW